MPFRSGLDLLRYRNQAVPLPFRVALSVVEDRNYREPHNRFPYNMLRNVALRKCEADYVFAADVDFVPFPMFSSKLLRERLKDLRVHTGSPNVLVIAAFEQVEKAEGLQGSATSAPVLDKSLLQKQVDNGDIIGFASAQYNAGHRCDHTAEFLRASQPYQASSRDETQMKRKRAL